MTVGNRLNRITKELSDIIEDDLGRSGLMYRIFYRAKTDASISQKVITKGYDTDGSKKLQDLIGIRVNLYFQDDLPIVHKFLKSSKWFRDEMVDKNSTTEFKPTRTNLIFQIPDRFRKEFSDIVTESYIDNTFEVQLRTILSEGWHEVDHDLRYKCKEDWSNHDDLSRLFNGVLASLETSDWTVINVFDQMSYRHYKSQNWSAMLRTKLRIRMTNTLISSEVSNAIQRSQDLQRALFKIEREPFITKFLSENYLMPFTIDNIILILNHLYIGNSDLKTLTTTEFIRSLKRLS